jgi:hypothetical protein
MPVAALAKNSDPRCYWLRLVEVVIARVDLATKNCKVWRFDASPAPDELEPDTDLVSGFRSSSCNVEHQLPAFVQTIGPEALHGLDREVRLSDAHKRRPDALLEDGPQNAREYDAKEVLEEPKNDICLTWQHYLVCQPWPGTVSEVFDLEGDQTLVTTVSVPKEEEGEEHAQFLSELQFSLKTLGTRGGQRTIFPDPCPEIIEWSQLSAKALASNRRSRTLFVVSLPDGVLARRIHLPGTGWS